MVHDTGSPRDRRAALMLLVVAIGVAVRIRQFLEWRSLWMDEAMLALNVVARPLSGLFDPLDYNQGAPVGFLVLQKLATAALGPSDVAVRIVPLLASCAAMALFAGVAATWLRRGALVAATLFAIAPSLVDYSVEAKQYTVDVALTVAILAALRPWVVGYEASRRQWTRLGLVGAAAPWLSHSSVFVLAGAGFVAAVRSIRAGWSSLFGLVGVAAAWAISVALVHEISLRSLSSNAALTGYWSASFAPFGSQELAPWTWGMTQAYLRDIAWIGGGAVGGGLLAAGFASMMLRRPELAIALVSPLALAWAASGLALYPYSGRMLLFAVPATLLLAAEALSGAASLAAAAVERFAGPRASHMAERLVLAVGALGVLAGPAAGSRDRFVDPRHPEAIRPALEYMLDRLEPNEAIYVYYGAKPAVNFYTYSLPIPAQALVLGRAHRTDPDAYRGEVRQVVSHPGAWIVLSHRCPGCRIDEWDVLLSELDSHGTRVEGLETNGAAVYHYRFANAGSAPPAVNTAGRAR